MLVLTRKLNETIMIGHDIRIMVVAIQGENVRLGIDAPKDISVHRQEVYDSINKPDGQPERRRL